MAIDEYRDFVLVVESVKNEASQAGSKIAVQVFDSPVGQGEKKEIVTLPEDLLTQLRWLEEAQLEDDLEGQIKLGEVLAEMLLPEYARKLYSASLARLRDGQGLRLRLRLADELANIPWEFAYIQDARGEKDSSGFLALDARLSIARHEAVAVPGDWFETPSQRRVVVAMASPEGHPKLKSLPEEQNKIRQALGEVEGIKAVFVPESLTTPGGVEQGATLEDLHLALMDRTDVFHFSGHGVFFERPGKALDSVVGQGSLLLASENNQPFAASAEKLAETLRSKGVRLVVLGACETGRRDGVNVWSGVAAALLRAGIPAVVAMQYEVNDFLAAAFDGAFYRALVAGLTVDEAVALGRAAMRVEAEKQEMVNIPDWGVPVLYLRSPGGAVFKPVKDEAAVDAAKEALGDLFDFEAERVEASGRVVGAVIGGLQTEPVTVDQRVTEEQAGLMIGAVRYGTQGGRLVVKQKMRTVTGIAIGGILGGGGTQEDVLRTLERLYQIGGGSSETGTNQPAAAPAAQPAPGQLSSNPQSQIKCSNCGTVNQAGVNFCSNCGIKLQPGPKFCSNCGAALTAGMSFCSSCGTRVA